MPITRTSRYRPRSSRRKLSRTALAGPGNYRVSYFNGPRRNPRYASAVAAYGLRKFRGRSFKNVFARQTGGRRRW
jgi:hypothetical protein